ncbi:MAG: PAS domain-containing protein [Brevibacterium sp.]|nr:PAS domain-containing protein [Brevibacterium sp.]
MRRSGASGRVRARGGPLARRLFFLQLALIVIVCAALSITSYVSALGSARDATSERVLSIAETLAHDPYVIRSVEASDASAKLQPYALTVISTADVDFVTIMDRDRTRYTHPDPQQLGKPYIGSIDPALAGHSHIENYVGTLGESVRAIVPVLDSSGDVTAMVTVGVTVKTLSVARAAALPQIIIVGLAAIALGGLGSWILSRYLRRVTLGYGPEELKSLFAFYDSALHSLREGLILVDDHGRLVLYNDEAAALLGLPEPDERTPVPLAEVDLPASVRALLSSGRDAVDEIHLTNDRVLVVSQKQASQPVGGRDEDPGGTVATLRDRTDIQELTGELETMTTLTEALRAQTHEHANRLHTVSTLIELGRAR